MKIPLRYFALMFPYLTILSMMGGILFAFLIKRPDFAIRGLIIAIPAIFSSLFLLIIYKKDINMAKTIYTGKQFSIKQSLLLYTILYIVSIIILFSFPHRTLQYFVIIMLLNVLIFSQILSRLAPPSIILSELIFVSLNLIYGVTLKYPLYFGGTDILVHLVYAKIVAMTGHIIPKNLDIFYYNFPLFHIWIAEGAHLTALSISTTYFIITAIPYAIIVILIYYIFKFVIKDDQIALSACLLYATSTIVVYYGYYTVTRVIAFFGFILLLYLNFKGYNQIKFKMLGLIVLSFMILVHQVSMAQFMVLIFAIMILERVVGDKKYIRINFLVLILISFLAYWFMVAFNFIEVVLRARLTPSIYESAIIKDSIQPGNAWYFIYTHIDVSIFIFFVLIGIGYILWRYGEKYPSVYALFALIGLVLYVPNPLQTLWQTMTLFRFDRFMLIISPFMALIMSYGLYIFYDYLKTNTTSKIIPVVIVLFLVASFSIISIAAEQNVSDTDIWEKQPALFFNEMDLLTFEHIDKFVENNSLLYSDYSASRYFSAQTKFDGSQNLNIKYYKTYMIKSPESIMNYSGYIIFRKEELSRTNKLYFGESGKIYNYLKSDDVENKLENELSRMNKIYSNSNTDIFSSKII